MEQKSDNQISLNKLISSTGFCSRREADRLIEEGRVSVNGEIVVSKGKIDAAADVRVDGQPLKAKDKPVYLMLNKPVGIICVTDQTVQDNIVDFVNHPTRIFPVGRLDKPSEGLILMTNDGDIVNRILRSDNAHDKEYQVTVDQKITPEFISGMANGVPILETVTKKCVVKKESAYVFRMVLTQGLNRQIRRMCEHFGYEVVKLKRTRIMNLELKGLGAGEWRYLSEKEEAELKASIADSVMTEEASVTGKKSGPSSRKSKRNYTTRHRSGNASKKHRS